MSEPERAHFCEPCGTSHGMPRCEVRRPVSDSSETLALIEEHRLTLAWREDGHYWVATAPWLDDQWDRAETIGDAVRACVARIKEAK